MRWLTSFVVVVAFAAQAEDEAQRRAREELEKQLNQLVEKVPARVRVEFQPIDDPNFQVEELELSVDGKTLKVPTAAAISGWIQDGAMPVGVVEVSPGRHKVSARVTVHNTASPMVTEEGDFRWKVAGDVGFEVAAGIEVKVIVAPVRDAAQRDLGKRLKLTFPSQPVMIAKLEDGTMPEPVKPKPVVAVDAGPTKEQLAAEALAAKKVMDAQKAEEAKLAKQQAAEEKKQKAEDAKLAKQQAAEEKKRKAEEAKLAKQQAAEDRKRKADEAKLAKQQAADEKKRKAEEAKLALLQAAEEKKRQAEEARPAVPEAPVDQQQAQEAVDAGAAAVVDPAPPVDAGPPPAVAVTPEPVDAGVVVATSAPADDSSGPPWGIIGGVGALALVVIGLLVRRAGRVPELKD